MREDLGLDVYMGNIGDMPFKDNSIDIIFMNDFIEHTYHPQDDLKAAARYLNSGGLLFLETFYLDSDRFEQLGTDWNMLTWPHIYHFSRTTLAQMVTNAGLTISEENPKENGIIEMLCRG